MNHTGFRHVLAACASTAFIAILAGCEKTPAQPSVSSDTGTKTPANEETTNADSNLSHEENTTMTDSSAAVLPNIHQFTMTRIDGHEQPLSEYKGKVVLVVNTASECGLTPQYEGLQALYEQYHDQGFEILGFPANNFGGQEPGTDAEIAEFCTANYSVTFPMFSKIEVIGDQQHPLYAELSRIEGGEPSWNFTKYLIGKDGSVLVRFDPRTPPNDSELTSALVRAVEK